MTIDQTAAVVAARIRPWRDFRGQLPHLFPTEASLRWFIRQHEQALTESGALLKLSRGNFIDPDPFKAVALELMTVTDPQGRQA